MSQTTRAFIIASEERAVSHAKAQRNPLETGSALRLCVRGLLPAAIFRAKAQEAALHESTKYPVAAL
jgi:hypothetical protein